MNITHPNCTDPDCRQCISDHLALESALIDRTGATMDHLREYRSFFEGNTGLNAETAIGWAIPEVFEEAHIDAYVAEFKIQTAS